MNDKTLIRGSIKAAILIALLILLCRFASGAMSIVIMALGCYWAMTYQTGKGLSCYALFAFMVCLNSYLLPKSGALGIVCRVAPVIMAAIFVLTNVAKRTQDRMPFHTLLPYLFFMTISSAQGYCPKVSYLKLVNFLAFWVGIWIGTQGLSQSPKEAATLRNFLFGLTIVLVYGSIVSLAFPGISYALDDEISRAMQEAGLEAAAQVYSYRKAERMGLFCGITFQSQALGPLLVCAASWVMADMLYVARRISSFHMAILAPMPILIFMTRSRTALFSFLVAGIMLLLYAGKKIALPNEVKAKVWKTVQAVLILAIIFGGVLELSNHTFTRWLRKVDNVAADDRELVQAVTETRMGLIARTMNEFHYNPLMGCGFQVDNTTQMFFGNSPGLVLSAPVEKGLLPVMVLGEGGIVGAFLFWGFIFAFCASCAKRRYTITLSLFVVFLATNIGEATFFSPGGVGGIEWVYALGGGFLLDSILLQQARSYVHYFNTGRRGYIYVK